MIRNKSSSGFQSPQNSLVLNSKKDSSTARLFQPSQIRVQTASAPKLRGRIFEEQRH